MTKPSTSQEQPPRAKIVADSLHPDDISNLGTQFEQSLTLSDGDRTAHGMAGDLAEEIYNAEQMVQTMPGLPTGYIRAGELYSSLGYQKRAMSLYQQGLNSTDSKYHDILQEQYKVAKVKDEIRADILAIVPYDIIVHIMSYLTTKEHLTLLDVSKGWRDLLSDCSSVWQSVVMSEADTLSVASIPLLARFGSDTVKITLNHMGAGCTTALISQLSEGSFNNLMSLDLHSCKIPSNDVLISALAHVSKTLKKLDIIMPLGMNPHEVTYKSVLATCQNLEHFSYETSAYLMQGTNGSLGAAYTSKLTDFHLHSPIVIQENVEDILLASPELRHLNIGQFCPTAVVNTALSQCKKLETFVCGSFGPGDRNRLWLNRHQNVSNASTGLRRFAAILLGDFHDCIPLFKNHCSTIEVLMLGIAPLAPDQWLPLIDEIGAFSNLQELELASDDIYGWNVAARLLRKCPVLTRLCCHFDGDIGNDIIREIVSAPKLKELKIAHSRGNEQSFRALFQGFVAKGSQLSTLQRVVLVDFDAGFPITAVLDHLPDISTLREFELGFCPSATEPMMANFCNRMQFHPSIETIKLANLDCVNDDTLKILAAINGLKHLKLHSLKNVTRQGIRVFRRSVKLDTVHCFNSQM